MRIASCLPAATAWLHAVGAGADIVGRSDKCPLLVGVPAAPEASKSIADVTVISEAGKIDFSLIRRLHPDFVIASDAQRAGLTAALPGTEILAVGPRSFKQAVDAGLRIARRADRTSQAMRFIADREYRLKRLRDKLGLTKSTPAARLPLVALLLPDDPPRAAGLWIPDVIELAGGRPLFATGGRPSVLLLEDELAAAAPDVLVRLSKSASSTACGESFGLGAAPGSRRPAVGAGAPLATGGSPAGPTRPPETAAAAARRNVTLDAALFRHPGPNLYEAVHLLSQVLHPARMERL